MTSEPEPHLWEVWHARFDYSEGKGYKFRPVIIVGTRPDGSIVMMVTSASNKLHMPHDYILKDWAEAGLVKPSIARIDRIAEIPGTYFGTAGRIGKLSNRDIENIKDIIRGIYALDFTWRFGSQ